MINVLSNDMKRLLLLVFTTIISVSAFAQAPKWQKKVRPIQLTVYTWDKAGQMRASQGIWLDGNGRAVTDYDVMKGAVRASVTDVRGKEYSVQTIDGASSLYNIAVLQTSAQKSTSMAFGTVAVRNASPVWVMPNSQADGKVPASADTVSQVDHFMDTYAYLTLSDTTTHDRQVSCPVLTDDGNLIGLLQPAIKAGRPACVIDLRYAQQLHTSSMDASRMDYRGIHITKTLPDDADAAQSFIYLTGMQDTAQYLALTDQYIAKYPDNPVGYTMKAEALTQAGRCDEAQQTYDKAFANKQVKQDEVHYSLARMMYRTSMQNPNPYPTWTLDKALSESQQAYSINPLPLYQNLTAFCQFGLKQYDDAEQTFLALSKTNMRSSDCFLYAAQCRQQRGDSIQAIIEMQDSALGCYTKPYPQAAAPIVLMRAMSLTEAGKTRQAVADYNEYEHLVGQDALTYMFYYQREQLEVKCRMYPAALNDIDRAIRMKPDEPVLYAELASLDYRVGQLDEAAIAAKKAIGIDPKFPDAYRIMGVILRQQSKSAESRQMLQKAADLGDAKAKEMLQ